MIGEIAIEKRKKEKEEEGIQNQNKKIFLDCESHSIDANSEDLDSLSGMSLASLEDI